MRDNPVHRPGLLQLLSPYRSVTAGSNNQSVRIFPATPAKRLAALHGRPAGHCTGIHNTNFRRAVRRRQGPAGRQQRGRQHFRLALIDFAAQGYYPKSVHGRPIQPDASGGLRIMPPPTTRSPSYNTAPWPGAMPNWGCEKAISTPPSPSGEASAAVAGWR